MFVRRTTNVGVSLIARREGANSAGDRRTGNHPGGARVVFQGTYEGLKESQDPVVRDFVARAPLTEPRTEAKEILRALVGE